MKINPLTKIISLATVLAAGFLLIVLAGAIYGNWSPVAIALVFAFAHLPIAISNQLNVNFDDFLNESTAYALDLGKFLSAFLFVSGVALPILLFHSHILQFPAMILTLSGGILIYGTVFTFTEFFDAREDDVFDV
ncbi:hypothetical protein LJB42_003601 [Komagataella kurtzmanii]|nr:hypothetical protein LJB42_003601 [Komagataella kurtzmanii]